MDRKTTRNVTKSGRSNFRRVLPSLGEAHRAKCGGPYRGSAPPDQIHFAIFLGRRFLPLRILPGLGMLGAFPKDLGHSQQIRDSVGRVLHEIARAQENVWPVAAVERAAVRWVVRSAGCGAGSATARNSLHHRGAWPPRLSDDGSPILSKKRSTPRSLRAVRGVFLRLEAIRLPEM